MLVIGIAGGSGSGKTTVVKEITKQLKERVVVIPQDSYYKDSSYLPLEDRQKINFDHPEAIDFKLLCKQLKELKEGKRIEQPVYSYLTCSRSTTETVTVEPADVIIIEGILVFTCKELREQMDIKIFVDADDDDRLMRVMARDIIERGKTVETVIQRYSRTVKPMSIACVSTASMVVPDWAEWSESIKGFSSLIWAYRSANRKEMVSTLEIDSIR